ncbi:MAG TPA: amidohydrolase family protein, partial [Verrucomicrobiae bacterium]
ALVSIAFPGRLIPFVAVNTLRKKHLEHLQRAVMERGFAGVKLYPSLGYEIDTPAMRKVYEFCAANDVPILLHCNRGGFYFTKADIEFCDPAAWDAVLKDFPALRVCFGHFGGDENLSRAVIPAASWTAHILELMEEYPGVYADIAYHTDCMAGGQAEKNYFANLSTLLARATVRDRILFGSDYFLVRQQLREDNLWRYFETNFTAAEFTRITTVNPAAFLGLPEESGNGAKPNVVRHLKFLAQNNTEVEAAPLPWVTKALKAETGQDVRFVVNPFGPRWTYKKHAHWYTDQFFRSLLGANVANRLTWTQTGSMLTRELPGWPPEQMTKENRQQVFRSFAREMHLFLVQDSVGAAPEKGVARPAAEAALAKMFANGDTQLFKVGQTVDRFYHFKDEANA